MLPPSSRSQIKGVSAPTKGPSAEADVAVPMQCLRGAVPVRAAKYITYEPSG